jgi:iron complex transport system substrate-binding protein
MRKMRKINRELIRSPFHLFLAILVSLAVIPAFAYDVVVPGDLDGDLIVSDEELVTAQSSYNDGKITSEELEKIEQINENYPRTVIDMAGREVTLYKPVERIITNNPDNTRIVIALGDGNLLVGVDKSVMNSGCVCPMTGDKQLICKDCWQSTVPGGLNNLPETGSGGPEFIPYYEEMAMLRPDLVFSPTWSPDQADEIEKRVGAPAFVTGELFADYELLAEHARSVGAVLSREEEAEDLIAFIDSKVKMVTDVTDIMPESEKPRVYFANRGAGESGSSLTTTTNAYYPLTMAGGINVAKDCAGGTINLEQLIVWNPDVIFLACSKPDNGAGVDYVLNAPELQSIKAVQEGRVYNVFSPHCCGQPHDKSLLNVIYMAKILYPDKFADIDMEKEGNEIMKAFLRVDGVFTDYADYLVWPREYLNSQ